MDHSLLCALRYFKQLISRVEAVVGGHKTKKETVTEALKKYIQLHKQLEIIELFDKIDYEPDYDYKQRRFRK